MDNSYPFGMARKKERIDRLTLRELLLMTPSEIHKRAETQCRPMRRQYSLGSKEGHQRSQMKHKTYYNEQRIWMRCTDGKRKTYLRFFGPPTRTTPVWVWCDCPYFTYYLETALTKFGCSSLKSSNGKPPTVRNPKQKPYLCKHLVVTATLALTQRRDYATDQAEKEMEVEEEKREKVKTPPPIKPLQKPPALKSVKPIAPAPAKPEPPAPPPEPEPEAEAESAEA